MNAVMTLDPFIVMWLPFTLNIILMWSYSGECRLTSLHLPFRFTAFVFPLSSQTSAEECFPEWQVRDSEKRRTVGSKFARHMDTRVLAMGIFFWEVRNGFRWLRSFAACLFIRHIAPRGVSFYFSVDRLDTCDMQQGMLCGFQADGDFL